jgi:hypothetical protein
MQMARDARKLADELDLTGRSVFFGSGWVPYDRRAAMLLEADVGVSLHLDDVETRYSFRTRVLDYLWAGLPVLTTEGDAMADLVAERDLGAVVPYGDAKAVAEAILELAEDGARRSACAARSTKAADLYHWPIAARALLDYCRDPWRAADQIVLHQETQGEPWDGRLAPPQEGRRLVARAWRSLRMEGPVGLLARSRAYLKRKVRS